MGKRGHLYHIINPSPWPVLTSIILLNVLVGFLLWVNKYILGSYIFWVGFILLLLVVDFWFRDIVREGTMEGKHTSLVQKGLKLGMLLFIVSEIMFFFSFFWGYFHFSLSPAIEIGCVWPPYGIQAFDYLHIPLYNTMVLLSSGVTVTWCHREIINQNKYWGECRVEVMWGKGEPKRDVWGRTYSVMGPIYSNRLKDIWMNYSRERLNYYYSKKFAYSPKTDHWAWPREFVQIYISLGLTLILALHFTYWQAKEYLISSFDITDGAYGSIFFMATGFHGFHVLLGTCFLAVCFIRVINYHFTKDHHLGLEFAIWYWHFVDVVWIFLFVVIYYGSKV